MEVSKLTLLLCSLNKLLCIVCRGEIKGMGSNDAMHHDHPQYYQELFKLHPLDKFFKALDD